MTFLVEEWENGPNSKRELEKPGKIKKDHLLFTVFTMFYFCLFITWEILIAFGSFLWRMIFKPEPKSLKGRVCLVTGAGRGLGRELCLALAREGAVLACVDIHESNNKTTAAMIKELGVKVVPYTVNVAIKNDVEDLVSRIEKDLGPVFLLVNNAAIVSCRIDNDEDFVRASFNVNLFGPIWMMNAVLPNMKLRNEGHIVNISSTAAKMVSPFLSVYGSTKAALSHMTNSIRAELQLMNQNNNIKLTTICPMFINTSNDYLRYLSLRVNMILEMEEVVNATMEAIHYNYEEVVLPRIVKYPNILLNEMMPSRTGTKLVALTCEKLMVPSEEQFQCLPWHNIVKECSRTEHVMGR